MRLQHLTWPDVEQYLKKNTGIIIPVGSTEQHGPSGLIGTDILCPELIAWQIAEEHGVMVAPSLSIGNAQHHMGFPGSMTLRPSTMIAMIVDVVNSLARHGFTHCYFLNGHGGNIPVVESAFSEIHTNTMLYAGKRVRCRLRNWWKGPSTQALIKKLYGDAEGGHATPSEIALSYLVAPEKFESEKQKKLSPEIAQNHPEFQDGENYRYLFPDGRIGSNPQLATKEHGQAFLATSTKEIYQDYIEFIEKREG